MKRILIFILDKFGYALIKLKKVSNADIQNVLNKGKTILTKITPENEILNGPFKGIKYTTTNITEATLVPKLVGSYESQLHQTIEKVIAKNYSDIIDIGCAEGYYAIGLAKRMENTTVHCFDINKSDIEICKEIAKLNKLSNLTFNYECSKEILKTFKFKTKGLIFCDTEGFELELFTSDVIESLKLQDFIIEIHDIINPTISNTLYERFKKTHNIEIFDNRNIDYSGYNGLEELSEEERQFAFFEHRGGYNLNVRMEWYYLTSKLA
jgi:23S rRNA U2552 (ribose-2'-O)-methylase RlmE/FtsJ